MNLILQRLKSKTPSIGDLQTLLCYNSETGELRWSSQTAKNIRGKVAGSISDRGYLYVKVSGKSCRAHRLAFAIHHGCFPKGDIDHINGIKTDNRICNLRDVSKSVNKQNQLKPRADNRLGIMGVACERDKYRAKISINGKRVDLGTYATPEQAHQIYLSAKRKWHIGCTI